MTLLSSSNISLIPGTTFLLKNNARCDFSKKAAKHTLRISDFGFPLLHRRDCSSLYKHAGHIVSAAEAEVNVRSTEQSSLGSGDASAPAAQPKNIRPGRKSEMPPVKNEELIPGAMFTGKVRAIQPFGAFVDFGASADGLVHVSRLSDSFVKDVGSVVSVGQEVKVRLIEADLQSGRISLSMRDDDDDAGKSQQLRDTSSGARDKKSTPMHNSRLPKPKYAVGELIEGIVKETTPTGSVISLSDGDEGFLPFTEEPGSDLRPESEKSNLNIGDSITVRVLRFSRGQTTLTLKEEDTDGEGDGGTFQGEAPAPVNPFLLAFRGNKEISTFLNEKEKAGTAT